MPKKIPATLIAEYSKDSTSTAIAVRIQSVKTGEVVGFTNCDTTVRFDDGDGMVSYSPTEELAPQNFQTSADMAVDNTKLTGWFDDLMERKFLAGVFESAKITIYRVAYLNLSAGWEVVGYGSVGEVDYASDAKERRKIEFRGLTQILAESTNQLYSLTCRAQFGDTKCKMPLVWESGTISAVGSNAQNKFTVSGINRPAGYFELGVINFVDGDNAGADLEIESWEAGGSVKISYASPYPVTVGTNVRLRRDCDKTETNCKAYGNIANMRAEHLTPTEDQSLMVPGAYIKNRNSL